MNNDAILGKLIDSDTPQERDAIHVAVVSLIAGENLPKGGKFRLAFGTTNTAIRGEYNGDQQPSGAIGIVDPFLREWQVEKGKRFWGLLFPGTVTGMRHHWQHPAFENVAIAKDEHELWLRKFADKWNFDFDEMIQSGTGTGDPEWRYVTARGRDLHDDSGLDSGEENLFWIHLEGFTGKTFGHEHRRDLQWACTC